MFLKPYSIEDEGRMKRGKHIDNAYQTIGYYLFHLNNDSFSSNWKALGLKNMDDLWTLAFFIKYYLKQDISISCEIEGAEAEIEEVFRNNKKLLTEIKPICFQKLKK